MQIERILANYKKPYELTRGEKIAREEKHTLLDDAVSLDLDQKQGKEHELSKHQHESQENDLPQPGPDATHAKEGSLRVVA